jgi:hypothetical protein
MMRHFGIGIVSLVLLPQLAIAKDDPSQLDTPARRELVRELSSEYATLKVSLPINSKGLTVDDTGEFDWEKHEMSLLRSGQFITAGIQVQITKIRFDKKKLRFELNGGGRKLKRRILERIYAGTATSVTPLARPSDASNPKGSHLTIKFDEFVPDLSPEEVKSILSTVLDFSKKSSTKSFMETQPEEFKEAIRNKRAAVGMDKDTVLASMGQPLRRVWETKEETVVEEWIYGERPYKVIFVEFHEGIVVTVKEY